MKPVMKTWIRWIHLLGVAFTAACTLLMNPAHAQLSNQDDCTNSGIDNVGPGTHTFDISGATTGTQGQAEALCYAFGTSAIDMDIWGTYTAVISGTAVVSTCNSTGTLNDSKIAAYPSGAACPADGTSLACNDDACGLFSTIAFPVTAGQSYILQIGTFPGGASGDGSVDISEVPIAPALSNQDDCANALIDTIGPGGYGWDNLGTTTGIEGQAEASCYKFGSSAVQSDVWAVYVPESNGAVTIETCGSVGSNADTKMAVYPLADCATIDGTSIACNDDTCGLRSQIIFDAICGESYLLQLGSFPGSSDGDATLLITESGSPCGSQGVGFTPNECNPANPNSTGVAATIRAEGSPVASAQNLTLIAESIPPGQFGYFFVSRTLGFVPNPGGSLGNICVLGNQGRYNNPSQIGQGPTMTLDVGAINVPTNPLPGEVIIPGDIWYWQAWYRDVGHTNNFTNVVRVVFLFCYVEVQGPRFVCPGVTQQYVAQTGPAGGALTWADDANAAGQLVVPAGAVLGSLRNVTANYSAAPGCTDTFVTRVSNGLPGGPGELTMCLACPLDCLTANSLATEATNWAMNNAAALGGGLGGGCADAARHAYWNALMARDLGAAKAQLFADAHEQSNFVNCQDNNMDLHNNLEGRGLAAAGLTNGQLQNRVVAALRRGELVAIQGGATVTTPGTCVITY
ncbi:MAG: hypothetical protein GY711_22855 [bacterium]|nr:hypothetical protein [bacterium]